MKQLDLNNSRLTPANFVWILREARKVAPARFMSLKMHLQMYKRVVDLATAQGDEQIQIGSCPGMVPGTRIDRICSVKPQSGVSQGIAIKVDDKMDPNEMIIEIHGVPELVVKGIHPLELN